MPTQSTSDGDDVVSITEAARLLGVSVRTVQRRLDAGQLQAVIEGDTRRVKLGNKGDSPTRHGDTTEGDVSRDSHAIAPPMARHDATLRAIEGDNRRDSTATHDASQGDTERDTSRDTATADQSTLMLLLSEKDARITDLRSQIDAQRLQIEAANRTASEAQASLREVLKMSNRALMEPGQSILSEASENAPQSAQNEPVSKETPGAMATQQTQPERSESASKYFERSKGLRAWLLRILKG